jgi:eukaryotic-like serine/threonine-protein kinase
VSELKTESLENLVPSSSSAEGPSVGEAEAAPQSNAVAAESGPSAGGSGGGHTPPSGSLAEVVPGTQLGRYKIIRRLGEGGMSTVFEAVHIDIHKPVAIKVLSNALAQQEEAQVRFLREAAAASRLQHPHVVDVADFGTDAGRSYLVMELMRGEDLAQHIQRKGVLSAEALADVMLPICAGVQAAHDMKIVHRDLKPQNIFICRTHMGGTVPKVLDFGISKVVDAEAAALTHSGMMMGTPYYLSPEQIIQNLADHRSDQYALGVILYECATGRRPHEAETLYGILNSITQGSYPRPRALRPEMPEAFEAIILRTLAQDANRRFPTVHALGAALMGFASEKQRMIWSDYYSGATMYDSTEFVPPVVTPSAGKSGSTELLRNDGSGSMPHNATRMLPEAMQSGSGVRNRPVAPEQTGRVSFADNDDDAISAIQGRPKGVIIAGVAAAVVLIGILIYAFSGSKKAPELPVQAAAVPKSESAAPVPAAMPPPVATKPVAAPEPVAEPARVEEVAKAAVEAKAAVPVAESGSSRRDRDSASRGHSEKTATAPTIKVGGDPAAAAPPGKKGVGSEKSGNAPILD